MNSAAISHVFDWKHDNHPFPSVYGSIVNDFKVVKQKPYDICEFCASKNDPSEKRLNCVSPFGKRFVLFQAFRLCQDEAFSQSHEWRRSEGRETRRNRLGS